MTDDDLAAYVQQLVDVAPPLTEEQRRRLRALLAMPESERQSTREAA